MGLRIGFGVQDAGFRTRREGVGSVGWRIGFRKFKVQVQGLGLGLRV